MDMMNLGTAIGIIGASLAVGLACSGSAKGVGACGEVGATVLAEDPAPRACTAWWPGSLP